MYMCCVASHASGLYYCQHNVLCMSCIVFTLATASTFSFVNKLALFFVVLCFLSILLYVYYVCIVYYVYCTVLYCAVLNTANAVHHVSPALCIIILCVLCTYHVFLYYIVW